MNFKSPLILVIATLSLVFRLYGQDEDPVFEISQERIRSSFFMTPINFDYFRDWEFQFIETVDYDSVIISSKNHARNNSIQKFFFKESGELESYATYSIENDSPIWISHTSFSAKENDSLTSITRSFTSNELNTHTIVEFFMMISSDSIKNEWNWTLFNVKKQPIDGWMIKRYEADKEYQISFKKYGKSIYFRYSSDGKLLGFMVIPSCSNGYCPKRDETINLRKGNRLLALGIGSPGGGYNYQDKGKTNFHLREEQILKKFGQDHGDIEELRIYRFNHDKYIKSVVIKRIVNGRFKKVSKLNYRYY